LRDWLRSLLLFFSPFAVPFPLSINDDCNTDAGDRYYDLKNVFAENWQNIGFFVFKLQPVFAKKMIITLVFEKKKPFFRPKLAKILAFLCSNYSQFFQKN
jgi:hypothetical protein